MVPTSSALQESANYTCRARSSEGEDRATHEVIAITPPSPPGISLITAHTYSLNLSIYSGSDGGAPILGEVLKIFFL